MDLIERLRRTVNDNIARMEAMANTAPVIERGGLNGTEAAEFERLDAETAGLQSRINELEELERKQGNAANVLGAFNHNTRRSPWDSDPGRLSGHEARGAALDCIERLSSDLVSDEVKSDICDSIERSRPADAEKLARYTVAASDPAYASAFAKLVAQPNAPMFDPNEARAFERVQYERAMSLTDTSGGYMVPFTLDPSVILTGSGSIDPMRQVARRVQIVTDTWNGVASEGVAASWDDEAEEVSDDSATLSQPSIPTHRLTSFVPLSIEVGADAVAFQQEAQRLIVDSFADAESAAFWTGSGTGEPTGLITALDGNTNVEFATTTANTFGIADVYAVQRQVPPRARRAGVTWAANLRYIRAMRRFGEGTTGSNSAYWADLGQGQPPLLLGDQIVEASAMFSGTLTTTGQNILTVGDFRNYVIVDRVGTTVELVPHLFGSNRRPTGQRGLFAYKRTGGDSVNDKQFRLLQNL